MRHECCSGSLQARPLKDADLAGLAFEAPGNDRCGRSRIASRQSPAELDYATVFRRDTGLAPLESEMRVVLDAHGEALLLLQLKETTRLRRTY